MVWFSTKFAANFPKLISRVCVYYYRAKNRREKRGLEEDARQRPKKNPEQLG